MNLDSARGLKKLLVPQVAVRGFNQARALALPRTAMAVEQARAGVVSTLALGVAHASGSTGDFRLAVRIQRRSLESSALLEHIVTTAQGEVDVRYVGAIRKRALPWQQQPCRPLFLGCSVGNYVITAGTLGCFVRPRAQPAGPLCILSNNHVLVNENSAAGGQKTIVQPAHNDNGAVPADIVAQLTDFTRLESAAANLVDAAFAEVSAGTNCDTVTLRDVNAALAGVGPPFLEKGIVVAKIGRTTLYTEGKVTAFELDNVSVDYDPPLGTLQFNDQIEIEGTGAAGFSDGGDSGALIWTQSDRRAIGLLFGGSDQGGANGQGLTYANPIQHVFDTLKVDLAI